MPAGAAKDKPSTAKTKGKLSMFTINWVFSNPILVIELSSPDSTPTPLDDEGWLAEPGPVLQPKECVGPKPKKDMEPEPRKRVVSDDCRLKYNIFDFFSFPNKFFVLNFFHIFLLIVLCSWKNFFLSKFCQIFGVKCFFFQTIIVLYGPPRGPFPYM